MTGKYYIKVQPISPHSFYANVVDSAGQVVHKTSALPQQSALTQARAWIQQNTSNAEQNQSAKRRDHIHTPCAKKRFEYTKAGTCRNC